MKFIRNFYFPISCFLAAVIYCCQLMEVGVPKLINNYFNDLVCMPIVLKICQYALRYIKSNPTLFIPIRLQGTVTVLFCIYFEYVLPNSTSRYTGDWLDVALYFLGMLFFLLIEQPYYLRQCTIGSGEKTMGVG